MICTVLLCTHIEEQLIETNMTISFIERENSTYEFLAISSAAVSQLVCFGDTAMNKGKLS